MSRFRVLAIFALFCAPVVRTAAQPVQWTRFLVPFANTQNRGAYGSVWKSEAWFLYRGTADTPVVPAPVCFNVCGLGTDVPPGLPPMLINNVSGPVLVHVDARHANAFHFASRIRDLSRQADSAGTETPVIREDEMSEGPLYLLNVPMRAGERAALRIYALPEVENPEVEVRYYRDPVSPPNFASTTLLRIERVALRRPAPVDYGEGIGVLGFVPSYAELGNLETLPELHGEEAVWIEMIPLTTGLRMWALASVTNNATQQVTVMSP